MSDSKPVVCSFESRRGSEMKSLIDRHGGEGVVVPTMQEVPLDDNTIAVEFADRLAAGEIDFVVFMTGVGAQTLRDALEISSRFDGFLSDLMKTQIILRGPKPKAVLHKWDVREFLEVKEPNTWRELVELIDETPLHLQGRAIAVQEYGIPNNDLYAELEARGATVVRVPVYRWKLPDDTAPMLDGIKRAIAGEFDCLMFTSAQQIRNLIQVANDAGLRDDFVSAAADCLVASVGPTCTEALAAEGLNAGFEASPPKMGPLTRGALNQLKQ